MLGTDLGSAYPPLSLTLTIMGGQTKLILDQCEEGNYILLQSRKRFHPLMVMVRLQEG